MAQVKDQELNKTIQDPGNLTDVDTSKKKEDKLKEPVVLGEFVQTYLLPIGLVAFSLILIVAVIIPMIGDLNTNVRDLSAKKEEYNDLLEEKRVREKLVAETNQQEADLTKINELIPQSQTAVVDFSEKIAEKATDNRVQLRDSVVGEIITATPTGAGSAATSGLELVELPAEFTITGRFSNIREFLSSLYGGDDFIIIKQMELQKQNVNTGGATGGDQSKFDSSSTDNWVMSIVLVKYQFRLGAGIEDSKLNQTFFAIPDRLRANKDVLDFINENYQ